MIAVIFEAVPADDGRAAYLEAAAELAPALRACDGFLAIERYQSLAQPAKLLSLSFWRDEEAIAAWRNREEHRAIQVAGRERLFTDYRLRVANVLRDYGLHDRAGAPVDSRDRHG